MMKKVFGALKAVGGFLKAHKKETAIVVIVTVGGFVAWAAIRSAIRQNTIPRNTRMPVTTAEEEEITTDVEDVSLFEEEQEEEQETTTTVTTVLPEEIIPTTTKAATTRKTATTTAAIVGTGTTGTNTITTATTTTATTTTTETTTTAAKTTTEETTTTTTTTTTAKTEEIVTIDKDEETIRLTYGEIQGMIMENFEDWYNHEIWIKGGICYLDTYVMVVSNSKGIGSFVQTSIGNGIVVGSSEKPGYAVLMTDDMG